MSRSSRHILLLITLLAAQLAGAAAMGQMELPPPNLGSPPARGDKDHPQVSGNSGQAPGDSAQIPFKPPPEVSVSARLDRTHVPRDESLSLIITLEWTESALEVNPPLEFDFPDPPSGEGLTLFANRLYSVTELKKNSVTVTRTYEYEFRADVEGETKVGPVSIAYKRTGSEEARDLETQPLPVTVTAPRLRLGKAVKSGPGLAVIIVALVAAVAGLVVSIVRARRKKLEAERPVAPEKTVHDEAAEGLLAADRLRMAGRNDEYMNAVQAAVKRYVRDAFGKRARTADEEKLAALVASRLGEEWNEGLADFFRVAGEVRFSGREPTREEMDKVMAFARSLVARAKAETETSGGA